jgi:hypothetical protein
VNPPEIRGYAIVSDDDRIADSSGHMPAALRNEADWAYFQSELDSVDIVALGRISHEATPNVRGRRRLVLSLTARGLERRGDVWWWNPRETSWGDVAARLIPNGGRVGVPGGQAAFVVFLPLGFASFHLSRVEGLALPGGRGLFKPCEIGFLASHLLRQAGLRSGETVTIDPAAKVTLTIWRTPARL